MTQILMFVAAHLSCLWEGARFRITDSEVTTVNGGNAALVVESEVLSLQFLRDRDQLRLIFAPATVPTPKTWYSIDLIRRLFDDEPGLEGLLDASYAEFLCAHLHEIERLFSPAEWDETRSRLQVLKRKRSKEMFG